MTLAQDKTKIIKKIINQIDAEPKNLQAHLELATILLTTQAYDEAFEFIQKALVIFPENEILLYQLGVSAYHLGQVDAAIEILKPLAQSKQVNALFMLGKLYHECHQDQKALVYALSAFEADQKAVDTQFLLGDIWLSLGDFQKAQEQFKSILQQEQNQAEAWFKLGLTQLVLNQSYQTAFYRAKQLDLQYFQKNQQQLVDLQRLIQVK